MSMFNEKTQLMKPEVYWKICSYNYVIVVTTKNIMQTAYKMIKNEF